jgi:hypothetical protein
MATDRQRRAARRNVQHAIAGARATRTIAHLPKRTRTALGKQGAAVARRELYEEARRRDIPGRSKIGRDELAKALGHG